MRPRKPEFAIKPSQKQRFTRTTITPDVLYASIPPLHTTLCSLLVAASPWPIKRGGRRPAAGMLTRKHTHFALLQHHTASPILTLASIILPGTWRLHLLSRLACSHPLRAPLVRINTVRTHSARRRALWLEPG
jgi:hypothetical protein